MNKQVCFWRNKTFYFLLVLFTLYSPNQVAAAAENPQSYQITVSATIGEPKLTLFGYTSPNALVQLEGSGVSEQVITNEQAYFLFDRIFLPRPDPDYPELCLVSIDTQSQISFPTCLPPLPTGPFEISIGPVLLPPTISLEKGSFLPGEQIAARGLTIPNSEVTIFLANNRIDKHLRGVSPAERGPLHLGGGIIHQVYAYSLPNYQIRADENGNFEFNLPSSSVGPATWRLFATATHFGSPTPKSNTLSFKVLSLWAWLWEKIKLFLGLAVGLIKPYWWQIIIVTEVILIILLFKLKTPRPRQAKRGGQSSNVKSTS